MDAGATPSDGGLPDAKVRSTAGLENFRGLLGVHAHSGLRARRIT